MAARKRRALGNPETGVFLLGFREEQRTRICLAHSNEKFAKRSSLRASPFIDMRERKSFLLLEILFINLKGIKRSRNIEEIVQRGLIKEFPVAAFFTSRLAMMRSIISESSG